MKQKSIKLLRKNDILRNKNNDIGKNSRNIQSNLNIKHNTNINNNIKYAKLIEAPSNNGVNANNISVKSKIKNIFSNKNFYQKTIINKDRYIHKKLLSETLKPDIFQDAKKNNRNQNDICIEESTTNFEENQNKEANQSLSDIKNDQKENIDIKNSITPIKPVMSTKNKIRYIKKSRSRNNNFVLKKSNCNQTIENNNSGNKIIKNILNNVKANNCYNSINKDCKIKNNNDLHIVVHDNNNGLKEINRKNITIITSVENKNNEKKGEYSIKVQEKESKQKKNIIILNFKGKKVNEVIKENNIFTPTQREISNNGTSLKNFDFFKNKKNEKILLKLKEKKAKEKSRELITDYNKTEGNMVENQNKNRTIKVFEKIKHKKGLSQNKSIFNEIIEEVKEEKNYVQKIVHRKLIQNIKDINRSNKLNELRENFFTKTSKRVDVKSAENQKTVFNIDPPALSDKKENNKEYLNNHLDDPQIRNENYIPFKMNNDNCRSIDYITIDNKDKESKKVKVKKIKLGKLKYKLKRNTTEHSLNENRIKTKVYTPKKISLSKKKIETMTIPVNCNQNPDYYNINTISSTLNNDKLYNITYINNIKPLDERLITEPYEINKANNTINNPSSMFHIRLTYKQKSHNNNNIIINNNLNNLNNNYNDINIYSNYNNNNSNRKKLSNVYSKAKIKQLTDINYDKSNNMNRSRTLKNIKKVKNKKEKTDKIKENIITKTQEIQLDGFSEKITDKKNINNFDKPKRNIYNADTPKKKVFINEIKEKLSNKVNESMKKNFSNFSQNCSININGFYNNLSNRKKNNAISRLRYNFSCDLIKNNNIYLDNLGLNNENIKNDIQFQKIINLLNFEDLLLIEDRFNLILMVLEKGNHSFEEYFSLWYYYYSSSLKLKIDQIYTYFPQDSIPIKVFINYSLIFLLICYDFAANRIKFDNDKDFNLNEIAQLIYTNILIVIYLMKSKIQLENKDNYYIRLIELSKIEITLKKRLSHFEYDIFLIKEILHNNSNIIITKIDSIIENKKLTKISKKYNSEIFSKIKSCSFEEINKFFLDNVLKTKFLGCSILANTFLKVKHKMPKTAPPYIREKNKKKYSLVLDLDETLIHFKINKNETEEGMLRLRPGIFSFLQKVGQYYEIILFTEASEAYAKLILEVFKDKKDNKYFDYVFYRQHTIIIGQDFIKDLTRIGRPLDKIIIIDNIPQNFRLQKDNGIAIKPFFGEDQNDQALINLAPILINIAKDEIDVRNGLMKYRDEILTKICSNLFMRNKQKQKL